MATNREERRQQRLRGAQRQPVGDLDFALSIPLTEPQPRNRRRATPQSELPPQPSGRRTPASLVRKKPVSAKSTQKRSAPEATPSSSAQTSAKRRKTDVPSSPRSTRSSHGKRPDLYDVPEEHVQPADPGPAGMESDIEDMLGEEEESMQMLSVRRTKSVPTSFETVLESPRNAPGSGQRLAVGGYKAQSLRSVPKKSIGSMELASTPRERQLVSELDALDDLSPDQPLTQGNKGQVQFSGVERGRDVDVEGVNTLSESMHIVQKPKMKSKGKAITKEMPQEDEAAEDPLPKRLPRSPPTQRRKQNRKASPAVQRQPKKKGKPDKAAIEPKSKEKFPIAVYRFTKPHVYAEEDSDADILNSEIPLAKRSGVNAVDVLAQMCEEIINSALDSLSEGVANADDGPTRKEYATKFNAVEAFQGELKTSLLQLTTVLDDEYSLTKRLKVSLKERDDLRTELLQIRAEREQVAIKMDKVRSNHEKNRKFAQEKIAINNAFTDIDLAITSAREAAPDATELSKPPLSELLKTVAASASSKSKEGGLLKQVKAFNAFLERAALAMEGRS